MMEINISYKISKTKGYIINNKDNREEEYISHYENREESCVICKYIMQKVSDNLEISEGCPNVVASKLIAQKELMYKADPDILNKWSILYNLQKFYHSKVMPEIQKTQNFEQEIYLKKMKDLENSINMKNLRDFENKLASDMRPPRLRKVKEVVVSSTPVEIEEEVTDRYRDKHIPKWTMSFMEFKSIIKNKIEKKNSTEVNNREVNSTVIKKDEIENIIDESEFVDDNLYKKYLENYNFDTQRRTRRDQKYPDLKWDCTFFQISQLTKYICQDEISKSYKKYCSNIFRNINSIVESFLYFDNIQQTCQNIDMCPIYSQ